jgi:hypothetical protein
MHSTHNTHASIASTSPALIASSPSSQRSGAPVLATSSSIVGDEMSAAAIASAATAAATPVAEPELGLLCRDNEAEFFLVIYHLYAECIFS